MSARDRGSGRFVFLSYARADREYVSRLAEHLTGEGVANWFDDELEVSERWSSVIEQRIVGCACVAVVVTASSAVSQWVERELLLAEGLQKPIYPLQLGGTRWWRLSDLQSVDVEDQHLPPRSFVDRLRRAVAVGARGALDTRAVPEGTTAIAQCLEVGDLAGADNVASALIAEAAGGGPIVTHDAARHLPDALLQLLCWIYRSNGGGSLRDRPFVTDDAFGTHGVGLSGVDPVTGRSILLDRLDELVISVAGGDGGLPSGRAR